MFLPRRNCYSRLVGLVYFKIESFLQRRNCYSGFVKYFLKADSNKWCRISARLELICAPKLPDSLAPFLLRISPSKIGLQWKSTAKRSKSTAFGSADFGRFRPIGDPLAPFRGYPAYMSARNPSGSPAIGPAGKITFGDPRSRDMGRAALRRAQPSRRRG